MGNVAEKKVKSNDNHSESGTLPSASPSTSNMMSEGVLRDASLVAVCARAVLNSCALTEVRLNLEESYGAIAAVSEAIEGTLDCEEMLAEGRAGVARLLARTRWSLTWLAGVERAVTVAELHRRAAGLPVAALAIVSASDAEDANVAAGCRDVQKLLRAALQGETATVTQ